jgi:hypothetical protein
MAQTASKYKKGSVSIYVVIFTALIVSVITVSFIRIMIGGQRLSTNADLAQSARDSALSGVEDAKIALLQYARECPNGLATDGGDETGPCHAINRRFEQCNGFHSWALGGEDSINQEVPVQANENDAALQQAYTCVTIATETPDFLGSMQSGVSHLVPLVPVGNNTIDTVEVSWYTVDDNSGGDGVVSPSDQAAIPGNRLSQSNDAWGINAPSLMRVQLIQTDDEFTLDQLDSQGIESNQTNRGTVFLYPVVGGTTWPSLNSSSPSLGASSIYGQVNEPLSVSCNPDFGSIYACTASVRLPNTIHGSNNRRNTLLKLTSYYKDRTTYRVAMKNGDQTVDFNNVQPAVDSTGRASNLFRRIESRIQMYGDALFPEFAIEMNSNGSGTGQICKLLTVTDRPNIGTDGQPGNTVYQCGTN